MPAISTYDVTTCIEDDTCILDISAVCEDSLHRKPALMLYRKIGVAASILLYIILHCAYKENYIANAPVLARTLYYKLKLYMWSSCLM